MNKYEEEADQLYEWAMQELIRIDEEYPHEPGMLDGEHMRESKRHTKEFNRRLLALKDKYGIDVAATG